MPVFFQYYQVTLIPAVMDIAEKEDKKEIYVDILAKVLDYLYEDDEVENKEGEYPKRRFYETEIEAVYQTLLDEFYEGVEDTTLPNVADVIEDITFGKYEERDGKIIPLNSIALMEKSNTVVYKKKKKKNRKSIAYNMVLAYEKLVERKERKKKTFVEFMKDKEAEKDMEVSKAIEVPMDIDEETLVIENHFISAKDFCVLMDEEGYDARDTEAHLRNFTGLWFISLPQSLWNKIFALCE